MQDYEKKITLEEIKKAAEWAKEASEPKPIDGTTRKYDQSNWDCGTSCCMWGAASIATGNGPASSGPTPEWSAQSHLHVCVAGLLNSGNSSPEQVIELLSGADLRSADLRDANLRGADLSGADLSGANLRDADLSDADLSDANLRDADLRDADLRGADLSGADLRDADLRDADLRDANVSIGNVTWRL